MIPVPPIEEVVRRRVFGSMQAYLDGEKNLKWVLGMIEFNCPPGYPIKNFLLSVCRLREQDESRKKEEEAEPFHCHVMCPVAVQFNIEAGGVALKQ